MWLLAPYLEPMFWYSQLNTGQKMSQNGSFSMSCKSSSGYCSSNISNKHSKLLGVVDDEIMYAYFQFLSNWVVIWAKIELEMLMHGKKGSSFQHRFCPNYITLHNSQIFYWTRWWLNVLRNRKVFHSYMIQRACFEPQNWAIFL